MGSVNPVEKHNPLLDVKSRTSSLTQSPPGKREAGYPLRKCSAPKQQQCTWSFPRKSLWLLVQLHGLGQEEYSKCHHGSPCKAKTSGGQAVISNSSWYKPTPFCHCDLMPSVDSKHMQTHPLANVLDPRCTFAGDWSNTSHLVFDLCSNSYRDRKRPNRWKYCLTNVINQSNISTRRMAEAIVKDLEDFGWQSSFYISISFISLSPGLHMAVNHHS